MPVMGCFVLMHQRVGELLQAFSTGRIPLAIPAGFSAFTCKAALSMKAAKASSLISLVPEARPSML